VQLANYCGGCGKLVRDECLHSFRRIGIVKVHWECWSDCNLPCEFCYRTLGSPLSTSQAEILISAVVAGGARTLVFAGGDPSIRPDIDTLIRRAHQHGLLVEVQTNAHHTPKKFLDELRSVEHVGLSLDGPNALVHDAFRKKPGNFERVLKLLDQLNRWKVPVLVRTVVAKSNHRSIHLIGPILQNMENLVRWSLLEFSPVGEGYLNRESYQLDRTQFRGAAERARGIFPQTSKIDVYEAEAKAGTYALITPGGDVYGTTVPTNDGRFPTIGSILQEHLSTLASKLPFSKELHLKRYSESPTPG
jgi:MoaA/NifB/PqqE/SkfB family radical SAM enzyme